jgi:hypothetical protein
LQDPPAARHAEELRAGFVGCDCRRTTPIRDPYRLVAAGLDSFLGVRG